MAAKGKCGWRFQGSSSAGCLTAHLVLRAFEGILNGAAADAPGAFQLSAASSTLLPSTPHIKDKLLVSATVATNTWEGGDGVGHWNTAAATTSNLQSSPNVTLCSCWYSAQPSAGHQAGLCIHMGVDVRSLEQAQRWIGGGWASKIQGLHQTPLCEQCMR